jgi:hypothetical protein
MVTFTAVVVAVGLVLFLIGSSRVSNEVTYDDQAPGLNLAILGTVLANMAGISLLLAGRHAVAGRRVEVLGAVPPIPRGLGPRATKLNAARLNAVGQNATAQIATDLLLGSDDLRHFHRGSCALAADRDWPARSRAEHEQAGRTPCGVCLS